MLDEEIDWDPEHARDFAKTIDAQSDRLTHLVANLLDMSRIQAGAVTPAVQAIAVEDLLPLP